MVKFNIVRKNNNKLVNTFNTLSDAQDALKAMGPQRNFMRIDEVNDTPSKKDRKAGQAELSQKILSVLSDAPDGMKCGDINRKLLAEGYTKSSIKKVTDRAFLLMQQGLLVRVDKGTYKIK